MDEKLKVEERRVAGLDEQLEDMANAVSQQQQELENKEEEIRSKEEETRAVIEREAKVQQQMKAESESKLQAMEQICQQLDA